MKQKILLIVLILVLLVGCGEVKTDEINSDITLEIWSFSDDLEKPIEYFEEQHQIAVELTVLDPEDYELKVHEVLDSGKQLPDLIVSDERWIKKWINEDYFITLSKEKYQDALMAYVYTFGQNQAGDLKAVSWQVNPTALIYKKQIAEDVWKTSEPEVIANKFSSHEMILKTASELKEANYKTFPSVDVIQWFYQFKPWLSPKNELGIHQDNLAFLTYKKTFVDNEYTALAPEFSPAYFQSINEKIPYNAGWNAVATVNSDRYAVFSYVLPKWGLDYVIKPNDNNEINDWGIVPIGDPVNRGGSYLSIVKGTEHIDEAKMFVEMMVLDEAFLETWHMQTKELLATKDLVYEDKEFLQDQDSYGFFYNEALKLSTQKTSPHYYEFNKIYERLSQQYVFGQLTKDELIVKYVEILKNNFDIIEK